MISTVKRHIFWPKLKANIAMFIAKCQECQLVKVENQIRQERARNEGHQQQIKSIQGYLLTVDNEDDKGESTQKLLNEKDNIIHCNVPVLTPLHQMYMMYIL